jgi:hypothetical protein
MPRNDGKASSLVIFRFLSLSVNVVTTVNDDVNNIVVGFSRTHTGAVSSTPQTTGVCNASV